MGLVFEKKVKGPATHAVVIGVGSYKRLPGGGSKKIYPNHEGLGQLTSPLFSAHYSYRSPSAFYSGTAD